MNQIKSIGRRKTSVARLYMKPGKGVFTVNNRPLEDYFPVDVLQTIALQSLVLTGQKDNFDISVNVFGGGIKGQAEAIRLAISRALVAVDEEHRPTLKTESFLTRDPRMVERKKYGRRKARRRFQFSKR